MNTKKELLSKITELESTTAKLKEQVASMVSSDVDVPWFPEDGNRYWFIDNVGRTRHNEWVDDDIDQHRLAFGNVYKTFMQAEIALDRRLAEVRVLRRIAELNTEQGWTVCFGGNQENHSAAIIQTGELERQFAWSYQALPAEYYGSQKTIETIMAELEEDYRLMLGGCFNVRN